MARRRIELDIGCGRGQFTLAAGLENPDSLIIGIDINEQSFALAEEARHRRDIDNVRFVHSEALGWLRDFVPADTVDAFHLYFPTPYMRTLRETNVLGSELKHWLFSAEFVGELKRVAIKGAILRVVTDSEPYFAQVRRIAADTMLAEVDWANPIQSKPFDQVVGTGCEKSMRALDRVISKAQFLLF